MHDQVEVRSFESVERSHVEHEQPNDVDAWWLYSYAVTDVDQARKALETVLRLDPAYTGARDLLGSFGGNFLAAVISRVLADAGKNEVRAGFLVGTLQMQGADPADCRRR